jgi:poly(glycerol-phosphate) alpha-glucosyltransferase
MHTICLLESVSRSDGGIFEAECALQRELHLGQGVQVDVVGMEDRFSSEDASRWLPLKPKAVKVKGPGAFGYSPDLLPVLNPKADLLYAATLWKYPSWAALQWAERTGKPMMVAPHGSLDAWALRNAVWKKRIAAALFKNRQLNKAACLRALCQSEADAFRAYGLTQPIAIIPNGVEIPKGDLKKPEAGNLKPETGGRKTLMFLGRIHPKKGLPNLIRAFAQSRGSRVEGREPWRLVIAGWDQGGHEAELIQLCEELGLKVERRRNGCEATAGPAKSSVEGQKRDVKSPPSAFSLQPSVLFHGPAFGRDKEDLLRSADAFILPSFSEGLPMSVLEAWSYRLPVVMTPECNLPEGFAADAAIRIETSVESIAEGLGTLFSMNDADLMTMGAKGRGLVEERFTWKSVASQMREVYDWMLGGGVAPSSVIME